jgi:hypothetical protein
VSEKSAKKEAKATAKAIKIAMNEPQEKRKAQQK